MCNHGFTDASAQVACRSMGLPWMGAQAAPSWVFQGGQGRIVLDQVGGQAAYAAMHCTTGSFEAFDNLLCGWQRIARVLRAGVLRGQRGPPGGLPQESVGDKQLQSL